VLACAAVGRAYALVCGTHPILSVVEDTWKALVKGAAQAGPNPV
jgi:hypothetical protein